jgi:hypothetical protein
MKMVEHDKKENLTNNRFCYILPTHCREGMMEKVNEQEGLVCICAECQKVLRVVGSVPRDGSALVSHGICPECADRLYGEIFRCKNA